MAKVKLKTPACFNSQSRPSSKEVGALMPAESTKASANEGTAISLPAPSSRLPLIQKLSHAHATRYKPAATAPSL